MNLSDIESLDLEARAHSEHAHALRLWLRLLTCSQLIEKRVRAGLREHFDTTLPRFDLMAQLERHPEGVVARQHGRPRALLFRAELAREQPVDRGATAPDSVAIMPVLM